MKRILSLILVFVFVLTGAFSVNGEQVSEEQITVYISISENGEFVTSPVTNEKMAGVPVEISYFDLVDYGLEEFYRYEADSFETGGGYINTTVVETPTLMHLFIEAVEKFYLGREYDFNEDVEALSFSGAATSAYASNFWGHDSNFTYLIDGSMPQMCAGWGASCDYILLEQGMDISICMFSSWDWATDGTAAVLGEKEQTVFEGGSVDFQVKGDPLFYGGSEQLDLDSEDVFLVKSSQLDWVNDDTAEYIFESDDNGLFNVRFEETGTFYVSAIDVNVGTQESSVAPAMCKVTVVASTPLPDYNGYWTSFRGNQNNMGVVDAKIPYAEGKAKLKWAEKYTDSWMDSTTPPILVNDSLYFAKNDKVLCVNTDDGELIAQSDSLVGNIGYGTTSITYGGGMFFVPVDGGVQALRADTLESLWVSENRGGQTISPITYFDGKVFCGTWNSETAEGEYFCLSVEDEDKNKKTETKEFLWSISHTGGFYWAGAYATEEYVVFGSDDGQPEGETGPAVLYSVNPENGEIIDTIDGLLGDIRSTVSYDEETDFIFFTTKGGSLCKVKMCADGTFEESTFEEYNLNGASTVTPLVYNGLAYIGVSGCESFENGGNGYKIIDVNASPMKEVALMETPGGVQSSALLTTAYEESGYVYVYITYNNIPGGIFELKVKKSDQTDDDGAAIVKLSSVELFVPEDDMAQYCLCSPICDENGVIYYKNDSGYLMAIRRKASTGGVTTNTGDNSYSENNNEEKPEDKTEVAEPEKTETEEKTEAEPEKVYQFADIKDHWAEDDVLSLVEKGIIKGKTNTIFAPEDHVTRAEFVTLLYRLSGDAATGEEVFDDVSDGDWHRDAIAWAVSNGITSGTLQNRFSPDMYITREMAAVFIARYFDYKKLETTETETAEFVDKDMISFWAKASVEKMKKAGIISGKDQGKFDPAGSTTRAEAARLINSILR